MNRNRDWKRSVWWLGVMLAVWGYFCAVGPLSVIAQQAAKAKPAAPPAASPPAASAPASGSEPEAAPPQSKSVLVWLIETSGWIGAVLLVLSIYFVAKVVHLYYDLRMEVAAPPEILQQCETLLKAKDFMGVYKLVKGDDSFFSTVLTAGLAELPQGLIEARDAMERVGETLVVEMETKISMLAVVGTLGPMIGLLGTLKGMIASFSAIALSDTQLKASQVAGGISEALVLTFEGVGLAVPAIFFFAVFRNKVSSISTATMLAADEFIRRTNALLRTKPTTGPINPSQG
ncbi:MAG TPA: MotA/TolQ/ExbB proton channel family protein [Planctomycetaceae bacterium]|jgi:biopolymer transport protein ExbB|nr:MotA/TolQ/ExbB proton channel family protein [Planctomycetaceae bacterium]